MLYEGVGKSSDPYGSEKLWNFNVIYVASEVLVCKVKIARFVMKIIKLALEHSAVLFVDEQGLGGSSSDS